MPLRPTLVPRRYLPHCLVVLTAVLSGCDRSDVNPTQVANVSDVRSLFSDPSRVATDEHGRLMVTPAFKDEGIITAERAGVLAKAYIHTYGRFLAESWKIQRGAPVAWERLRIDPRILYAASPYHRIPRTFEAADRRHFGPWYLVHFTADDATVLTVAVSAFATDLEISSDGRIDQPSVTGEHFKSAAVSLDPEVGPTQYSPVTPEAAIEHVATLTGAQMADVPRLLLRDDHWHPVLAQWHVRLDRPVKVRRESDGAVINTQDLYVSSKRRVAVPLTEQPAGKRVSVVAGTAPRGKAPPLVSLDLQRRPEVPTEFAVASLQP